MRSKGKFRFQRVSRSRSLTSYRYYSAALLLIKKRTRSNVDGLYPPTTKIHLACTFATVSVAGSLIADNTIATSQIIEDPVDHACAVHSRKFRVIVALLSSCLQCLAQQEYSAINLVQDRTLLAGMPNLHTHVMKTMYHAHPVPSSSRRSACAARTQSRMSDVVRRMYHVVRLVVGFCRVVTINAGRCATFLENVKTARRLVENRKLSAVIHAKRNGEQALYVMLRAIIHTNCLALSS